MRGNRPHRTDANQMGIVRALRQIPGVSVFETHMVGKGFPDIVIGYKGKNTLIELKATSKDKLTLPEQSFQLYWTGEVFVCSTLGTVLDCVGIVMNPRRKGKE
jgi:hypothetical protein